MTITGKSPQKKPRTPPTLGKLYLKKVFSLNGFILGLRFDVIIFISCCFVVPCYLVVLIDYIFTVVVYFCFIVVLLCYSYISIVIGYGNLDMLKFC